MSRLIDTYDEAFTREVETALRADEGFADAALADLPAALRARFGVELAQPLVLRRAGDRYVVTAAAANDELPDEMLEHASGGKGAYQGGH